MQSDPPRSSRNLDGPAFLLWNRLTEPFWRTEKTESFVRGSFASLAVWVSSLALRFLMGVIVVRVLGASRYGVYAYAITWLGFLAIPTTLGLDHVTLRFMASYRETRAWTMMRGLLRFAFPLGLRAGIAVAALSIGVVAIVPGISWEFRTTMWISLSLLPVVVLTQIRQSCLRGLDHPVLAQLPENVVYPVLLMALVVAYDLLSGASLTASGAAVANAFAWLVAFGVGTALLLRGIPSSARSGAPEDSDRDRWREMILPLVFSGAAYHFFYRGEVFVLGVLGTSRDVGLYAVASRAAEQLTLLVYTAVTFAGPSLFSSIHATGDKEELQRFTTLVTRTVLWASLPVYVIVMLATPWILAAFGHEFVEATSVMRLLVSAFFVGSLSGFVILELYMTGHQKDAAITMAAMAAVNVGLAAALIPSMGTMGAAVASAASLLLLHSTLVVLLYKREGILSLPLALPRAGAHADGNQ